jgi:hypothetical protein
MARGPKSYKPVPLLNRIIGFVYIIPSGIPKIRERNLNPSLDTMSKAISFALIIAKKKTAGQIYEKKKFNFRYLFQALNDKVAEGGWCYI